MDNPVSIESIQECFIEVRGQRVLLDADVARIYGVETKRVNEAVKNNPDKFPHGYLFELSAEEWESLKTPSSASACPGLRSKISTAKITKTRVPPKAFPEKGLYMLATILKSPRATAATLGIIEAYATLRGLSATLGALAAETDAEQRKSLMRRGGALASELFAAHLQPTDSETRLELNFAVLKFRHSVTRRRVGDESRVPTE